MTVDVTAGADPRVVPALIEHAGELYTVQRAAYVSEALLNDALRIPPLLETLDGVRADLLDPAVPVFTAWLGNRLVGSVRGRPDGERMEVVRLSVAPDVQGRGIGRALLGTVEAAAPAGVRMLWLVTGGRSVANIGMYQRFGYRLVGQRPDAEGVPVAVLEKPVG